jgi:hypothetical protein
MGAPTQYYVDPAINAASGTGTIGDPFGDLQYGLNTIVRDAVNGDQVNIKAGVAEVLAASLTLATYGAPTANAPLILRGYTAVANDGGIAEIDCNGVTFWLVNTYASYILAELEIHTFGDNHGVNAGGSSSAKVFYRCEIHKGASAPTSKFLLYCSGAADLVVGCHIHDAGTAGIGIYTGQLVFGNYIYNCPGGAIYQAFMTLNNLIVNCTLGIAYCAYIIGNTVYSSAASTSTGILTNVARSIMINNIVEGYSGVGGKGIQNFSNDTGILGFNAFYNNTTNESFATDILIDLGNDGVLAASPFVDPAAGNFALKSSAGAGVLESAFPGALFGILTTLNKADRGAIQAGAGAGGGAVVISPFRGNIG